MPFPVTTVLAEQRDIASSGEKGEVMADPTPNSTIHDVARDLATRWQDQAPTPARPGQYWDGIAGLYNVKPTTDADTAGSDTDPNHQSGLLGIACEPIS